MKSASKFSLGGLSVTSVKSGDRISAEFEPIVETSTQLNKFRVNKPAAELMKVTSNNKIKLLIVDGRTVEEGKYLLAVTSEEDVTGAKLGGSSDSAGSLGFNYSGMWAKMVQSDNDDAQEKSKEQFAKEGEMVLRSKTAYINRKVAYKVTQVEDIDAENPLIDPFTKEAYTQVFFLHSPEVTPVDLARYATEVATEAAEGVNVTIAEEVEFNSED